MKRICLVVMLLISMMVLTGFAIAERTQPVNDLPQTIDTPSTTIGSLSAGAPDIKKVSAYQNYQFSYTPGVACKYCEYQKGSKLYSTSSPYFMNYLYLNMVGLAQDVYAFCPLQSIISRNGIHPKIRYYHFAVEATDNYVDLDYINVMNGRSLTGSIETSGLNIYGYNEYYLDMGSYYDMTRGVTLLFNVDNNINSASGFAIHGYGHREEW